jgi:hypothetical protein
VIDKQNWHRPLHPRQQRFRRSILIAFCRSQANGMPKSDDQVSGGLRELLRR